MKPYFKSLRAFINFKTFWRKALNEPIIPKCYLPSAWVRAGENLTPPYLQQAIKNRVETAEYQKIGGNTPERRRADNRSTHTVTLQNPGTLHETYWIP